MPKVGTIWHRPPHMNVQIVYSIFILVTESLNYHVIKLVSTIKTTRVYLYLFYSNSKQHWTATHAVSTQDDIMNDVGFIFIREINFQEPFNN